MLDQIPQQQNSESPFLKKAPNVSADYRSLRTALPAYVFLYSPTPSVTHQGSIWTPVSGILRSRKIRREVNMTWGFPTSPPHPCPFPASKSPHSFLHLSLPLAALCVDKAHEGLLYSGGGEVFVFQNYFQSLLPPLISYSTAHCSLLLGKQSR